MARHGALWRVRLLSDGFCASPCRSVSFPAVRFHFVALPCVLLVALLCRFESSQLSALLRRLDTLRFDPSASSPYPVILQPCFSASIRLVTFRLPVCANLITSNPYRSASAQVRALPCHSTSDHFVLFSAYPSPVSSSPPAPFMAMPFPFFAPGCAAMTGHSSSDQSLARQCSALALRFSTNQGNSVSLLCQTYHCHLGANERLALLIRFRSDSFAAAGRVSVAILIRPVLGTSFPYPRRAFLVVSPQRLSVSHRVSTARCRIGSDQRQSQHLKSMSIQLKANQG